MMYPTYGVHTPDTLPLSSPQDVFFDDASTQRALRRLSKSSSGQRAGAASTRVSKPNSTSSSPRSSSMAGRRRTMMANDSWTPQRQPTPEAFSQTRQPPVMPQGSILYDPLDEPEEEGEILVGMGLYDTPDKVREDPQLNNYRSTVSSLLGSPYRQQEPKGKGLKLEETWEPPAKTDHDADDDEDEGDDDA